MRQREMKCKIKTGKNRQKELIMWQEFKKFIMRGNVMDLAIGVIIGGAFGKIVSSLVDDVFMPPIGLLLGKVNFSNLFINLGDTKYANLADAKSAGAPTLNYGLFINNVVYFLILAVIVFFMVKALNRISKKEEAPVEVTTRECPHCLSVIAKKADRCPHCTSEIEPVD
jgi:large conductance mechanosensitive channel